MQPIQVIYENGVLRPLSPIELPEGAKVEVIVIERPELSTVEPAVGEELAKLLDEIATLPYTPHPDGRTDISTHHDDVLYPKNGKML